MSWAEEIQTSWSPVLGIVWAKGVSVQDIDVVTVIAVSLLSTGIPLFYHPHTVEGYGFRVLGFVNYRCWAEACRCG